MTIEEQGTFRHLGHSASGLDRDPLSGEVEYEPVVPPDSELEPSLEFTETEVSGAAA